MALMEKVEASVDIKTSADKFFNFLSTQNHALPNICSDKFKAVDVHEGDWETTGSVRLWKYNLEGKEEVLKEKVEIDKENKLMAFTALEGHCFDEYRSCKFIFQVTPKGEGGSVKMTVEYEKLHPNIPPPNKYLNFGTSVFKDMDAHLLPA